MAEDIHPGWRSAWRDLLAPKLPAAGLEALRDELTEPDCGRLVQGTTAVPWISVRGEGAAAEGACAVGYCGWMGEKLTTVGEVESFIAAVCASCEAESPGSVRLFLNEWDGTPRGCLCDKFLPEVERELSRREGVSDV